ncbi:MAG: hypothetical protein RIB65_13930 [Ilumatobacter fluminis]|uniref:hypothetical protein n=1 Tax=Ilumatobacter fluminis TaxID=467091 RepID=UPI0032EF71E5
MGGKLVAALVSVALVGASSGVTDAGPSGGALPPELIQVLVVAGNHGIPDDAEMVAVNITAVAPAEAGHITAYACDQELPTASNLNYGTGEVVPNLALVRIGGDGSICIATHAVVDLVVDVVGYVPAGSSITALDAPVRVVDTRSVGGAVTGGTTRTVDIGGFVDNDATLAMLNLTSVAATAPGHATIFSCTDDVPNASSVNYIPGRTVANFVIARLSTDHAICLYSHATGHFVVDLVAYSTGGITTLDQPRRIHDSRASAHPVEGDETLRLDIAGQPGVPGSATAAVYNLTAAAPTAPGHATSYPCDERRPDASNLNYRPGRNSANGTITKLSPTGELCLHTLATTHLVVDLVGYTTDNASYTALTPRRIIDSRAGWRRTCDWIVISNHARFSGPAVVTAINLETFDTVDIELPEGHRIQSESATHPVMDHDCSAVLHYGGGRLHRFGLDGSRSSTAVLTRQLPGTIHAQVANGALRAMHDGSVVLIDDQVTDLTSGAVIGPGAPSDITYDGYEYVRVDVTIAENHSVIAAIYESRFYDLPVIVRTWRPDGSDIATWEMHAPTSSISSTPDGRYIGVDTQPDDDLPATTWVLSPWGDVIDLRTGWGTELESTFVGNGEMVACVRYGGLFRFDVFGPSEHLLAWYDLTPLTNHGCHALGA